MTGLDHHLQLCDQLSERPPEGARYRQLLEDVLGFSLVGSIVSTSEHIAPFNSLTTVSFILPQLALAYLGLRLPSSLVILGGSLVPLDNADFPRGFVLPLSNSNGKSNRFNLFPDRLRKTSSVLQQAVQCLDSQDAKAFFDRYPWLRNAFQTIDGFATYAQQISHCMEKLAVTWFPTALPVNVHVRPLEEVAREVLLRLLEEGDPWLKRLLFNKQQRSAITRALHGVFCAWGDRQGSFLFWAACNGHALRLWEDNNALVGENFRLPLEPMEIETSLRNGTIWPGVFLSLLAVSYLPNIPVAGGPKQLHYYESMIEAANQIEGISRQTALSRFGYNSVALDDRCLPKVGTGLALTDERLDFGAFIRDLSQTALLPSVRATYA